MICYSRTAPAAALTVALLGAPKLTAQAVDTRATAVHQQVRALALPSDIESRRAAIVARLEQIGLAPQLVRFDPPPARANRRGANVVANVSGTAPDVLLLGAHYDHVDRAQGVVDNAAGVAAVLHLAEAFARRPLSNFAVRVALFDLEENGLLGSRAMVSDSLNTPLPQMYLNFDVFGYGNAFWIGTLDTAAALPSSIRGTAEREGWHVVVDSLYPPSDHLSFRRTSTRSYAVSIVDSADVHVILAQLRGTRPSAAPPKIMRILHTTEDTMDKLDAAAVARALDVVEQAIRRMDAEAGR